eukprot:scaffold18320_cov17-Tisochrysis_lutea.AAC.3
MENAWCTLMLDGGRGTKLDSGCNFMLEGKVDPLSHAMRKMPNTKLFWRVIAGLDDNALNEHQIARAYWLDDQWHHVAATWDADSGTAAVYFDGKPTTPFWKAEGGSRSTVHPDDGGVDPIVAPRSNRGTDGSLVLGQSHCWTDNSSVLGQDQDCFGGCFSSSDAFKGDMAVVRVWRRVLDISE